MGKFKLKDQLAGIAALIAASVAIGGGFVKYGEVMTRLDVLSEQTGPDLTPLAQQIGNNLKNISDNVGLISNNAKSAAVLTKEIELLKLRIILFIFSEKGLPLSAFSWALFNFAAATIFIALVIFCVDLMLEILFFKSSKLGIKC